MARKPTKLTIVPTEPATILVNTTGTDIVLSADGDTGAYMIDYTALPAAGIVLAEPVAIVRPDGAEAYAASLHTAAPIVPSLAELQAMAQSEIDATPVAEGYTLAIAGQYDSLIAAGMFAASFAKAIGLQVCIIGADGAPVRCYDPPIKRARGDKAAAVSAGPRGADWTSKSGQSIKLMMRPDGATMDEMKEITGWTFGQKYTNQLMRSFGVTITTRDATARTKRTWHATVVASIKADADQTDDAGQTDDDAAPDVDAAAGLMMAAE